MGWILFLVIVVVAVIAIKLNNKNYNGTTETKLSKNEEMQELLLKTEDIAIQALTSTEMSSEEKADIMAKVIKSLNESADDVPARLKKITLSAYDILKEKTDIYSKSVIESMQNFQSDIKDKEMIDVDDIEDLIVSSLSTKESKPKMTQYFTDSEGSYYAFSVAGIKFRTEDELSRIKVLEYAEELTLIPEPENEYDPNAIAIYTKDDSLIGYVPAKMTDLMRDELGYLKKNRCIVKKVTDDKYPFVNLRIEFE